MHHDPGTAATDVRSQDDDPFAEHPGSVARRRRNGRRALIVLCAAVALARGLWAVDTVTYTPEPGPKAVCPMLRPELLDVALPERGPAEDTGGRDDNGFLAAGCTVRGASGDLWISVIRMGRAGGKGPQEHLRLSRGWLAPMRSVPLGDEALLVSDRVLTIRQGSYLVWIEYGLNGDYAGRNKTKVILAIGQEVLSQL